MTAADGYPLLIEQVAQRMGFDQVSHWLFNNEAYAPYLFVLTVVIVDVPILSTISYLFVDGRTFHPLIDLPAWPLIPLALVLGVFGMRQIRAKYVRAREEAGRSDDPIQVGTPERLRMALFLAVVCIYLLYYAMDLPQVFETEGIVIGGIKYLVIIPFVYYLVLTDFVTVYLHGLYFLPVEITRQQLPLDFSSKFGGMEAVGSLLITASIFYFVELTLWTGSTILNNSRMELKAFVLHGIMWVVGIVLFLSALWILHRYMAAQKQEELDKVTKRIRSSGSDEEVFPYITPNGSEERTEYMVLYANLDRIEQTRTYPLNTDRLLELFGAIMIPILLQAISLWL